MKAIILSSQENTLNDSKEIGPKLISSPQLIDSPAHKFSSHSDREPKRVGQQPQHVALQFGDDHMINPLPESLQSLAEQAYSAGFARHGGFRLKPQQFFTHLLSIIQKHFASIPQPNRLVSFFNGLHTNDLYLCAACSQSGEEAWDYFVTNYKGAIIGLAHSACANSEVAIEIAERVMADLFLPDRSGCSRIASYDGRSSLATWLRAIVIYLAYKEHKSKYNNHERLECMADIADEASIDKIESAVRSNKYKTIIGDSFKWASESLTHRQRAILLFRYEQELQVGQIARIFGVDSSTVTRHLQVIHAKLHDEFISILDSRHRLSIDGIKECLEEVMDNPEHSILNFLKQC